MKRFRPLLFAIVLAITFSCETNLVDPIDIFATEELRDTLNLNLGSDGGLDKLMVNADRVIETPTGYHVKGTVFSQSASGIIPVTSGDFSIDTKLPLSSLSKGFSGLEFKGYGTANFPSMGLFSSVDQSEIPGSEVYYNTGKIFRAESKIGLLPLFDDRYYFRFRPDKANGGKEYRMKKITVRLKEYYLDARDPGALLIGDIYSQSGAGAKKLIAEQVGLGISANELWDFVPFTYSENLEKVTGGTGFERMNGGISLTGIIPIKKYPLEIIGQAVINTSFSSSGPLDFFERGFDDASFQLGVNGELFFTNDLVKFLTNVDTVRLGKATLQAKFSDESFSIRMAGEYSDDVLDRFLGETMMKFIPTHSREGVMYLRGTEDPDDFIIYIEEKISLQIPGLGVVPVANSTFRVTMNEVGLTGKITLPYNIGEVEVSGLVRNDGTFLLKGITNCNVDIGAGLIYNADLAVEITERGVSMKGAMSLPYGIGNVDVAGGILIDEIYFSGVINSAIPFPVNTSVNSDLNVSISSKTGVTLGGSLSLPGGIGNVSVTGRLNTVELLLTGTVRSGIAINFGNVDVNTNAAMSLSASSVSGVVMTGAVSLPFSLGNASVSVRVAPGGLSMSGNMGSSINITGYPLFNANMSVSASTSGGLYLSGRMLFPGNFSWVSVSGFVRNNGFNLTGNIASASIDFEIVSLSTDFSMSISNTNGIRTSASGKGCIDLVLEELCESVGVDIYIDYYNNSLELCMDFPVVGDACVGW